MVKDIGKILYEIDNLMAKKDKIIVAIDGNSASGKTTELYFIS